MHSFVDIPFHILLAYGIQIGVYKQSVGSLCVLGVIIVAISSVLSAYFRVLNHRADVAKFGPGGAAALRAAYFEDSEQTSSEAVPLQAVAVDVSYSSSSYTQNKQRELARQERQRQEEQAEQERQRKFLLRQSDSEYTFVESTDDSV